MQLEQNLPPQPEHWPPDAFAAPQPSQHGGLRQALGLAGLQICPLAGSLGLLLLLLLLPAGEPTPG
jgi:hypothetical protein